MNAPRDNGLIVNVIKAVELNPNGCSVEGPYWLVKSIGSKFHIRPDFQAKSAIWPDSMLRPIRDNPGADETLTWAPAPIKEAA